LHLLEVVDRQAVLLQVVGALRPPGRLAALLHGGQEQADQDRDDRDHDQQLDQGETASSLPHSSNLLDAKQKEGSRRIRGPRAPVLPAPTSPPPARRAARPEPDRDRPVPWSEPWPRDPLARVSPHILVTARGGQAPATWPIRIKRRMRQAATGKVDARPH